MQNKRFRHLMLIILIFVSSGCVSKEHDNKKALKHMIQSEKLRLLMRELDMVVYERQKSELDRDKMRKRYMLSLGDTLKHLSAEIENMSESDLGLKLTQEDIQEYKRYAKNLSLDADEIYDLAHKYEFELLNKKLEDVKVSCNACHKQFRKEL
ncbi:hypothetical protein [Sulfurimonas sp.]|uniref:hypothetical protein n=1 Tax=Sulfurimonas sp. TaxID=2022749 RepID=UPI0025D95DE5|nr:hypothetical protein [Sulfurimonas sp.]